MDASTGLIVSLVILCVVTVTAVTNPEALPALFDALTFWDNITTMEEAPVGDGTDAVPDTQPTGPP